MEPFQQPPGFERLSKAEQIRYLQDLWDRVSEQPAELPVPPSHLELLAQRKAAYEQDPSAARSAFDVLRRLTKQSR
jgi:putative addiction module component (TIGR02574 family)